MQKLINSRGPIEDPSPMASASRSLITGQTDGLLSYKTTSNLISSSSCCFSHWDIDSHLLGLLKVCILLLQVVVKKFIYSGLGCCFSNIMCLCMKWNLLCLLVCMSVMEGDSWT